MRITRACKPDALARRHVLQGHGVLGVALVSVWWPLSWLQVGSLGEHSFFPLWLGYILTVDALVCRRKGSSLLTRSPVKFWCMFLASAPLWWTFEGINHFTENWRYLGAEHYSLLRYAVVASWNFSTVIPAVFETADLLGTFGFVAHFRQGPSVRTGPGLLFGAVLLGVVTMGAMVVWPRYAYPLTWLSLFLVLDPVNHLRRRPSILSRLGNGDWRPVVTFAAGALICGWFWEMWNFWGMPKWEYSVPFVDFARVFEMPILGYLGYLPFGLEVYAGYSFVSGLFGWATSVLFLKYAYKIEQC